MDAPGLSRALLTSTKQQRHRPHAWRPCAPRPSHGQEHGQPLPTLVGAGGQRGLIALAALHAKNTDALGVCEGWIIKGAHGCIHFHGVRNRKSTQGEFRRHLVCLVQAHPTRTVRSLALKKIIFASLEPGDYGPRDVVHDGQDSEPHPAENGRMPSGAPDGFSVRGAKQPVSLRAVCACDEQQRQAVRSDTNSPIGQNLGVVTCRADSKADAGARMRTWIGGAIRDGNHGLCATEDDIQDTPGVWPDRSPANCAEWSW
ncbi:hypothetical protein AURDEDRAFT_177721 [Auricularia subglabra TFB-10046 SS5]|uniref:Uncharacterized protein n=1 Tax=Auricularia subglabra (strain TFB-10046 / SS5) TaxID=717982 RepID=J0WMY7_AURST|nr:hypothetical protein AURDEDRAFT_177721 [Auricularia subglabra TFB-10046 SS5]